jgi:hypothetical protein
MDRQKDVQTDKWAGRQIEAQTDKWAADSRSTDRQIGWQTNGQIDRQMNT